MLKSGMLHGKRMKIGERGGGKECSTLNIQCDMGVIQTLLCSPCTRNDNNVFPK